MVGNTWNAKITPGFNALSGEARGIRNGKSCDPDFSLVPQSIQELVREWSGVILSLNKGDIDLIWNGMTIKPERAEKIDFSKPYLANTQAIAVLADSDIKKKKDLADKSIGVQLGSPSEEAIAADEKVGGKTGEIRKYGKYPEALLDLSAGRIDAVVGDAILLRYYLAKKPGEYKVIKEDFGAEEYGIGFRKNDDSFREAVDNALDEMRKDGKAAEISNKWFGDNIVLD